MKKIIWTIGHRPFICGGSVYYPLGAKVAVKGPFKIGGGLFAYVATAPNTKQFVAESTTGAIVGNSLERVREDRRYAPKAIVKQQILDAKEQRKKIELVSEKEFWKMLRCEKEARNVRI